MTRALHLSDDLSLPLRAVTEKLGFLGRTGSGKTYAAQKLAEEMHAADAQFVVLDPVGVWYGLRLAADGKAPGLPVPVLGGLHGDIPLEPGAGALIANLVVDRGVSMVLDVSQFESDADKARFAQAFADRFFFRKKAAPSAVHVFLEECQEFVPQNPQREDARMLHAFTRLVKIGRNFGIGVSLISQRPQEVNKKVLNLTELLFAFQLTGPQERKTLQGWIAEKGIDEDIAGELPKLKVGAPHVWSPAWLQISKVVTIARKTTYDASSTPTVGDRAAARALAPIDLERLRVDMAATIEKAKAEDPRELKRRIAELERQVLAKPAHTMTGNIPAPKRVEVPILKDAQIKRLEYLVGRLEAIEKQFAGWRAALDARAEDVRAVATEIAATVRAKLIQAPAVVRPPLPPHYATPPTRPTITRASQPVTVKAAGPPADGLDAPQQRILDTILMLSVRGIPATRDAVARWMGLHPTGGRYGTNLGFLRAEGYLAGFMLTERGQRVARAIPTGPDAALDALPDEPTRQVLRAVMDAGAPLTRDALAAVLGLHPTGGRYGTNLGRLRTMGLITERGPIAPTEGLFR